MQWHWINAKSVFYNRNGWKCSFNVHKSWIILQQANQDKTLCKHQLIRRKEFYEFQCDFHPESQSHTSFLFNEESKSSLQVKQLHCRRHRTCSAYIKHIYTCSMSGKCAHNEENQSSPINHFRVQSWLLKSLSISNQQQRICREKVACAKVNSIKIIFLSRQVFLASVYRTINRECKVRRGRFVERKNSQSNSKCLVSEWIAGEKRR